MLDTDSFERRGCERRSIQRTVGVVAQSDPVREYQETTTVDLSEKGARVRGNVGLTPGQAIDLISRHAPTHTTDVVPAQVIWVNQVSDGSGEAGLKFTEPAKLPRSILAARV